MRNRAVVKRRVQRAQRCWVDGAQRGLSQESGVYRVEVQGNEVSSGIWSFGGPRPLGGLKRA